MSNIDKMIELFRDVLQLPPEVDVETLAYRQVVQWDSVGHMQLVAALETEFDIMLETEEIIGMSSFAKTKETLLHHGVTFEA